MFKQMADIFTLHNEQIIEATEEATPLTTQEENPTGNN